MTDPELETAIDRAVRELMSVDADSAFRTRVTARLAQPAPRTWVPRLVAAVVTAAAIVACLIWMRPSPLNAPESTAAGRTAPPAPVVSPQVPQSGLPKLPVRRVERRAARRIPTAASVGAIPPGIIVATGVETTSGALAPLESLEAIQVPPIAQSYIAPADIVVAELSPIAELQVSPLEPPTARY
jgi:hypothetical protein